MTTEIIEAYDKAIKACEDCLKGSSLMIKGLVVCAIFMIIGFISMIFNPAFYFVFTIIGVVILCITVLYLVITDVYSDLIKS